jgi:hypothetical protein
MSLLKATGIISDHIGTAPVAGIGMGGLTLGSLGPMNMSMNMPITPGGMSIPMGPGVSMGMGPLGFGAIRQTGSLGGLTPVSFSRKGNSVLHPAGMPIATTLNPFNPYDANSTIVTQPFGGLSGLSGLDLASFGGLAGLVGTTIEKAYNSNGVNVVIRGCNSDVNAIVKCLDENLSMSTGKTATKSTSTMTTTTTPTIASTKAAVAPAPAAPAPVAPAPATSSVFATAPSTSVFATAPTI